MAVRYCVHGCLCNTIFKYQRSHLLRLRSKAWLDTSAFAQSNYFYCKNILSERFSKITLKIIKVKVVQTLCYMPQQLFLVIFSSVWGSGTKIYIQNVNVFQVTLKKMCCCCIFLCIECCMLTSCSSAANTFDKLWPTPLVNRLTGITGRQPFCWQVFF